MRYSPSTRGFYPEIISYPNLPEDIITVTDAEHKAVINKPDGATVEVKDGKIKIILPKEKTTEEKLSALKTIVNGNIKAKSSQLLSTLTGNVTPEERDTWPEKVIAAKASVDAQEATEEAIALFKDEADALGKTVLERCERALELRQKYLTLVGLVAGFKTKLELEVTQADTIEKVQKINDKISDEAQTLIDDFMG